MELVQGGGGMLESAGGGSRQAVTTKSRIRPTGLAGWVLGLMDRREGLKAAPHLRVLETLSLGGRRQMMLVVCDGERFLVGAGADRIDTIVAVNPVKKPMEGTC